MKIKLPDNFSLEIYPHARPSDEFLWRLIEFYHGQPNVELTELWKSVLSLFQQRLLDALKARDATKLGDVLCSMYGTDLTWGLDDWNTRESERPWPVACLSLANAIGLGRMENPEQPGNEDIPLSDVLDDIDAYFGCRVGRMGGGGMNGLCQGGRFIPRKFLEVLTTIVSLMRLPQWKPARVMELGAGLGFMGSALNMLIPNVWYETIDLPTVSVMQAYLLSFCVGDKSIWLAGEQRVSAHRIFINGTTLKGTGGFDFAINQDSLPEMPHSTQDEYLTLIRDRLHPYGAFVSVNHEGSAANQRSVHLAMKNVTGMKLKSRHPYWGRIGYVEEVWEKQ